MLPALPNPYRLSDGQQAAITVGVLGATFAGFMVAAFAQGRIDHATAVAKQQAYAGAQAGVQNKLCTAPVLGGILNWAGQCG